MIRVGLIGGRGYVGEELLHLLAPMNEYEIVFVGSRSSAGKPVATGIQGLDPGFTFSDLSEASIRSCPADAWIIAQDNGQAAQFVPLCGSDARVIDISSDYRFESDWVYGLPERNAKKIAATKRVANPGCYATAVQLGLLPIVDSLDNGIHPVAFGVSGYSGAGRTPNEKNDLRRLRDSLLPYALTGHGHEREVSFHLNRDVRFSPHVAPFFRGISITLAVTLDQVHEVGEIQAAYEVAYADSPLVEVVSAPPEISMVRQTNKCIVGGFSIDQRDPRRMVLVSVIDNLRKGAASQAIENLNLMFGLPSPTGLMS